LILSGGVGFFSEQKIIIFSKIFQFERKSQILGMGVGGVELGWFIGFFSKTPINIPEQQEFSSSAHLLSAC